MASKKTSAKTTSAKTTSAKTASAKTTNAKTDVSDGKGPSPGVLQYALASARTTLGDGDEDTVVTEEGDVVKFACRGVPYATLRVDGNDIVVTFLKPKNESDLDPKRKHYKAAHKSGWLEYRTPVSRDPRPWLEANFGDVVGQTLYEILHGGRAT